MSNLFFFDPLNAAISVVIVGREERDRGERGDRRQREGKDSHSINGKRLLLKKGPHAEKMEKTLREGLRRFQRRRQDSQVG